MSDGHIKDPQLNDFKDFGYLVWDQCDESSPDKDLKCRTLLYLKDRESRKYTCDTPVTFKVVNRTILGCRVQLATNVRVDKKRIKNHPLIAEINQFIGKSLPKYLRWLKKRDK